MTITTNEAGHIVVQQGDVWVELNESNEYVQCSELILIDNGIVNVEKTRDMAAVLLAVADLIEDKPVSRTCENYKWHEALEDDV